MKKLKDILDEAYQLDLQRRKEIAELALKYLKEGIQLKNRLMILDAYKRVEDKYFYWDSLDEIFEEWNKLVDRGNDIVFD